MGVDHPPPEFQAGRERYPLIRAPGGQDNVGGVGCEVCRELPLRFVGGQVDE